MMKEKSKNAAKTRREKEKVEFQELARLLPLPDTISGQLDKASVIRLATAFLRLRRLLIENETSKTSRLQQPGFPQQQSLPQTPGLPFQTQCHKSLTDTSNTGFVQPKLPCSTPPPCSTPYDSSEGAQSTGKFNGSFQAGQQLAQALDGFVMVVGADGKLIYVSEAASLHLGLSQVEMTGQPVGEYLHQDDHTELISLINFYKSQLLAVHNQQDFRIPVSVVLRMKCVLAKRNAGIVHGGMKVIHCVGYIRSIPPAPVAQPSPMSGGSSWSTSGARSGGYGDFGGMPGAASPSPPNNGMPMSLGNGLFIEDRTIDDERDVQGGCRTSSSAGSGGARVPSPHVSCSSPPLPSFAPFAIFLVGCTVPPASATELRLASSSLFMLRTTLDMKLLFVETPRVTELLGYEPQDLIEKNLYNLIHCDDLRTFRACHQLLLIKGQCVTSYYRVLTRDGGWVWVQSVQTIVSNSRSSRPHCIVSVNHVISQDQQIFSTSPYPAASFLPRRSSTCLQSATSIPDACAAASASMPILAGPPVDLQRQLLIKAPRSLAASSTPTLVKPSPVQASMSVFQQAAAQQQQDAFRSSGFTQVATSAASTQCKALALPQQSQMLPVDESSRSVVPSNWQQQQQRSMVPQTTAGFGTTDHVSSSPFQHGRSTYHGYHMGGFSSGTPGAADFFQNEAGMYSFFNKSAAGMGSTVDSYASLFNGGGSTTQSDFGPPMTPMTPMTPSMLNTPAPTPLAMNGSRFGTATDSSSCLQQPPSSQQQQSQQSQQQSQNGGSAGGNSLQLVGGIHAHTINYTLHIENFNASASATTNAISNSTTTTLAGSDSHQTRQDQQQQQQQQQQQVDRINGSSSCLTKKQQQAQHHQQQQQQQQQNGANNFTGPADTVASAVASAGLVLGSAPTTIVMCGQQQGNQQQNLPPQQQTTMTSATAGWYTSSTMQEQSYFSSTGSGAADTRSAWNAVTGLQNNRQGTLTSSSATTALQTTKMNGHHLNNQNGTNGTNGTNGNGHHHAHHNGHHLSAMGVVNASGLKRAYNGSPFSQTPSAVTGGGVSVIMGPQPPSGVIEPLAKRLTTAPTPTAWLNPLQQQP